MRSYNARLDDLRKRQAEMKKPGGGHTTGSTAVKEGVRARAKNPRLGWANKLRGK